MLNDHLFPSLLYFNVWLFFLSSFTTTTTTTTNVRVVVTERWGPHTVLFHNSISHHTSTALGHDFPLSCLLCDFHRGVSIKVT
jgi:hypothetical protein